MDAVVASLSPYLDPGGGERLPKRAYAALRGAIRDLKLEPGRMVREREAAEALGMSRTPVREALVRLEAEGWLRLVPRHGFVVAPLEADDLREIYEVAEGLEGAAAALAAGRAEPEMLDDLEHSIAVQEEALGADDLLTWADLDDRFHDRLVRLAGNACLREAMGNYDDQLHRARLFTILLRPKPTRSVDEHRAVVAALRAGDAEAARGLLQDHRRRARDEILRVVRALAPSTTPG